MQLSFDRGTIILRSPPDFFDPENLPGVRWDARIAAHRAPARFHSEIVAELDRKSVRYTDSVRQPDSTSENDWSAIELRPYQDAALAAWEIAKQRGVIALPTGSGKTHIALAAIARHRKSTLCLVPTRMLLQQWRVVLARVYRGPIGVLGDGSRTLSALTIATFESGWRRMAEIGNRFDLLIVDEAHHFGNGLRDEALEMSTAQARLGLSATPPTGLAADRLEELIGPTVYELSIDDLAGRYLANFDSITLRLDLYRDERINYERLITPFKDLRQTFRKLAPEADWVEFVRWAMRTPNGRQALTDWRHARSLLSLTLGKQKALAELLRRHHDARVLVFTADNEAAYTIARQQLIMPLTCDIGRSEREEVLQKFREGQLHALVSARVLNEGIDVPDADIGIVVGGAQGEREHVQRVGRLLRPREGKRAVVYELVARGTLEERQAQRRGEGLAPRIAAAL